MNTLLSWRSIAVLLFLEFLVGCSRGISPEDCFDSKVQIELLRATTRAEVDILIGKGADINALGKNGVNALIFSMMENNKNTFKSLLEAGADPNLAALNGHAAIFYAAQHREVWYLQEILKHGGNPNLVDFYIKNPSDSNAGRTPVYFSVHGLLPTHVKALVAAGANLNFQDKNGNTPALDAALINQYEMVYLLLSEGADPWVENRHGNTLAYPILHNGIDPTSSNAAWRLKVIKLLKSKGMDVDAAIQNGKK